jgi:hypothetical protein
MLGPGEWTFDNETQKATCSKLCPVIDELYVVTIELDQYNSWKSGGHIQNVMPELNTNEREFLLSGMTPAMWDNIFGEIEE